MHRALITLVLMATAPSVLALGGQNMVLGRMVAARPDAPSVAPTTHPRANFVLHCAGCHGVRGEGVTHAYVPDLRRLGDFLRVPGGRAYVVSVPGVMGSGLDDAQVAAVTNWLLETVARASVPDGHQPFSPQEVSLARSRPLADVAAERRRLQAQARAQGLVID